MTTKTLDIVARVALLIVAVIAFLVWWVPWTEEHASMLAPLVLIIPLGAIVAAVAHVLRDEHVQEDSS